MNTFLTLLSREVKSFFYSPIAYVVLFYFLFLSGFNFYSQVSIMNGYPTEVTVVEAFFMPALFWFPFVLSFPLITMRVYSEEFRMGTFETLTTAPVHDWQVVLSKFFGVFIFYIILWTPSLCSFAAFQYITGKMAANAAGAYWGTYLLLMLMGGFYIAIGCLASALTKDQINAATISFTTVTLLLFIGFLPDIMNITAPAIKDIFSYVSSIQHMQDFSKGIIDSRPIVWYLSVAILILIETFQIFQARKWNEGNVAYSILLRILAVAAIFGAYALYQRGHVDPKWDKFAIVGAIAVGGVCLVLFYRVLLGMKGKHLQIGLNVVLQLSIFWLIVIMANYMSFRHFKRWDFSRDKKYAISSQTKSLLKNLQKPVKAVVFFSSAAEIAPDVTSLLREYEYASEGKFKAELVDPFRSFTRAQELQTQYKFGANENIVILDIAGKSKFVNAADMAEFDMPDQMSMMMGQTQPRLKAFKGEQAITSALLELTEGKPNKVYYVTGQGEPDLKSPDLKIFTESLKRQNIQIAPLTLLNINTIPDDARSLIICGPKYDFSDGEMKLINDFWEKKGRVFVLLNPYAKPAHLTDWLQAQGVVPQEDRVIRTGTFLKMDDAGKPQLTSGVISDPAFIVLDSHTKITKDLEGISKKLLGATQSLQVDQARATISKLHIIPVLQSAEGFWGETDLAGGDDKVAFDPKTDLPGPLNLALAVEKGGLDDQRVKMESSRLFVVGNAELLGGNDYRLSEGVSADLTINVLNWLLDREDVIGIAPREKKNVTLSLDEKQLRNLALAVMAIVPGIVAFFGLINWWQRRA